MPTTQPTRTTNNCFTDLERSVLEQLYLTSSEIAEDLGLSPRSVEELIRRILSKLHATNRTNAFRKGIILGLVLVPRKSRTYPGYVPALSANELQVLSLLDLSNQEIADGVKRSLRMVEQEVSSLLKKLGATTRTQALLIGIHLEHVQVPHKAR